MVTTSRSFECVTFNVEWAKPASPRLEEIRSRLNLETADLVCLTEAYNGSLSDLFCIEAEPDYGYPLKDGRRKVMLASREPWTDVITSPSNDMPPGRFVTGKTVVSGEDVAVIGLCVPWSAAHVSTGRRDRVRWQDHVSYLEALVDVLPESPVRTILMGDFNQTIPRSRAPIVAYEKLEQAILKKFDVVSAGLTFDEKPAIDHIALSRDLHRTGCKAISNVKGTTKLSDHFGVSSTVSLRPSTSCDHQL